MSVNYSASLSDYPNKGLVGDTEIFDNDEVFEVNIKKFADLVNQSKHIIIHTGAGISTSIGIPDFRGPNGVWTKEKKGEKPSFNKKFTEVLPSPTHRALYTMEKEGILKHLITQNVDGLHFRFGFPRNRLSILHGDMFIEKCAKCHQSYYRLRDVVPTIGLKKTQFKCIKSECGGDLIDSVLDWEHDLPDPDYSTAKKHSSLADLHICLGTSLQIFPAADFPMKGVAKTRKRKLNATTTKSPTNLVIVNLQKTKLDKYCTIRFFRRVDEVMEKLCSLLNIEIEPLESFTEYNETLERLTPKPMINLKSRHTLANEKCLHHQMMIHPDDRE